MQRKLLGIISVDFDITGELLFIYSVSIKYLPPPPKKVGGEYDEAVHQLFIG
jgi:hypothetical protein